MEIWQQWVLLGCRTWWHIGLEEDWNKLSQFHVKLFLVLLKCNTLIKLWRIWKIGKLVFFSVSPIPLAVTKQVEGVGYMAAHLQQKSSFYFQKTPTHTRTVWATSEGKSQGIISIQQFSEKNIKYQINFICGRFHQTSAPVLRCFFFKLFVFWFRDTVDNCILDFTPRMLYKFSWLPAFWELFLEALTPLLLTFVDWTN